MLLLPLLRLLLGAARHCRPAATAASCKARQVDWTAQRQLPASGAAAPLAQLLL